MEQSSEKRVKSDTPHSYARTPPTTILRDPPFLSSTSRRNAKGRERKEKKRKRQLSPSGEEEYILRDILKEEVRRGKLYYLIDWEGIDPNTGKDFEHTWEPAEYANEEAVRDWKAKKKLLAEEIADKDFSSISNTQSSEPIRGPKRRRTKRRSSSSTPKRPTGTPEALNTGASKASLLNSQKKRPHHGSPVEIKDSYEEDTSLSVDARLARKPVVEISSASKKIDPSEYRVVSIYSQDTQPIPSYSDSEEDSQGPRKSPVRLFQRPSRPRNPFEEIPIEEQSPIDSPSVSAAKLLPVSSSESSKGAVLIIPDSQDLGASASYEVSTLQSTGVTSEGWVHSQPNTQGQLSDRPLTAHSDNSSPHTRGSLVTEISPTGSSSYRASISHFPDSGSQSDSGPSHQSDSLNPITASEKSSLKINESQRYSIDHSNSEKTSSDNSALSGEREVDVAAQGHTSSAPNIFVNQTTTSQPLLPIPHTEDEGYSEPPASDLNDSQSFPASYHSSHSGEKVLSQPLPLSSSSTKTLRQLSNNSSQFHGSEPGPFPASHRIAPPLSQTDIASPLTVVRPEVTVPSIETAPKEGVILFESAASKQAFQPTFVSHLDYTREAPSSAFHAQGIIQSIETQQDIHFPSCTPRSKVRMESNSASLGTLSGSKDTVALLREARQQASAKRAAERAAARSASTMPATPPPPPVLEHPLPLREVIAEKLVSKSEVPAALEPAPSANISRQPSPLPETDVKEGMTRDLSIAILGDDEYIVPLPLVAHTRDVYVASLRKRKEQRLAFFHGSTDKVIVGDIEEMLEELARICDHLDLIASDYSTQRETSNETQAKYAETISTKCIFIAELVGALRPHDKHLVILSRSGRMQEILQTVLIRHGFGKPENSHTFFDNSDGSLRISILPTDGAYVDASLEPASVVVAFSPVSDVRPYSNLRTNPATPSRRAPLLSLIITHSIEHLNLCFDQSIRGIDRNLKLATCISQIQRNVGKSSADDYPPPPEAAVAVAQFLTGPDNEWLIPQIPIIHGMDLRRLPSTDHSDSRLDQQLSGSTTQSWDVPFTQQVSASKRQLIDHETDFESTKRQRLTPFPDGQIDDSQLTHVSVSTGTASSAKISAQIDVQQPSQQSDTSSHGVNDRVITLERKVGDLGNELRLKEASNTELRLANQELEERLHNMELSFQKIQPRFQEALNDRAHFEKEITSALQVQARLQQKADAKDELERELSEARAALSSSSIPEIAAFNKLKGEILALKTEIDRLEKRRITASNEQAFFSNQYQLASAEAQQAKQQNAIYEEELKALRPKCASNAVEIHQIHNDSEISQHLDKIRQLAALNAEYERELEKKNEELRALKNGRRGATRGTSVPRSPRLGAGTMSPGNGAVRRVVAHGSRGNSPAPSELARGQFGEALFQGMGTGRWATHLQQ